ncbi:hypothetical protein G6011_11524 [Alternaria panax]|uniref:Fungal STAND N-terminal Goodbye domain-containing protein n=1 Tax=Alternaria panax TaxID=48097 RepID=A0AAD4NTE6_9PLEO|nr:hypothetical protein G6011_11524 [Alternaria panax]
MRFGRGHDEPDPPDPIFTEDQDLREVWPQVLRQYEETTKKQLDKNTTFKSFQLQIDADIKESTTKSHQHARTVLNNVGTCLEKFGNIIAQGASTAFPPTAQCWNAISFVVQAVRGFNDMMDGFVTLMERSSAFLRRLVHFMEQEVGKDGSQLPRLLRKPAYDILSQFLGVLRASYKLATSTTKRLKAMAGVLLFNSNDQVAESLKLMENHIKDFTRAEVDDILLGVRGVARHLDKSDAERALHEAEVKEYLQATYKIGDQVLSVTQQMKTTLDGRASKEQQKENLLKLANHLGLKKAGDWETWSKRHSELCKTHVPGTGEWLSQDQPAFRRWADLDQHGKKVLFLKADSGFGKTHIFNSVVSHLEKKCRAPRGPNQTFLAYYYYGDEKDDSLERCIGSIIYQFAVADVGYAQAVVDECGRLTSIARAEDRWKNLVSGLQHAMKGTYFICMDGFDGRGQLDTTEAMMSAIALDATSPAEGSGVSLRLFLSGNDDALPEVLPGVKAIDTIFLGPRKDSIQSIERAGDDLDIALPSEPLPNASDLRAVTIARINEVCKTKPDLKAILSEANIELLLEGIHGNYKNLEAKITEINACDTKGKVQDVINNTSADMDTVQRNRVKALDAHLTSRQALVLNRLLVWVAGLSYPPSTKLLESVLFITSEEEFLLADQIATAYSPVLVIDKEGRVGFRDGLKDILSAGDTSGSESTLSRLHAEAISGAEVNLCRRFIQNACHPTDYARFRFDDFFEAMAQKVHIHLDNEDDVNITILELCIDALYDTRKDENLEELRDYASKWFYSHLKDLVEALDKDFEPSKKFLTETGIRLVDLIYDPKLIDTWFFEKNLSWLKYDFLYQEDFIDPLLKFLKNSQVARGYAGSIEKSTWVKSAISDTASKYSILERVAARLASHWFSCSTGTTDRDYLWISYGIVAKIFEPEKPFEGWNTPSLAEMNKFICWAKEHMDVDVDSLTWDFRVGATSVVFEHYKEAIVALEKAAEHSQTNWGLFFNLALAHENEKNHRMALKYIKHFKSLSDLFLETDSRYKVDYWDLLRAEGNCHRQGHDYDSAILSFQHLLSQDIDEESGMRWLHLDALSGLFTTWIEMKSYQSIIDFVRNWKDATNQDRGSTYWLRRTAYEDDVHTSIIVAAKFVGAVGEVISLYQVAIDYKPANVSTGDDQEVDTSTEATEQLQYFQAVLRFHGSGSQDDQHKSIEYWEEIVRRSDDNPTSYMTAWTASRKLAPTLLDKAVAELVTVPSSSSENYISRLEKLANMNTTVVCNLRQGYLDPRLCLARLYCLKRDHASASMQAQARLCSVFDKWPEATDDKTFRLRFSNLAQTLTVLDKDIDAVAAWQAIKPCPPSHASVVDANVPDTGSLAKPGSEVSHGNVVSATFGNKVENDSEAFSSDATMAKAYISGYVCDGKCGTTWTYMLADFYVCKHCLCVQFCPGCYDKLLVGDLHPLICNKDHKMLKLPPFDWIAWRTIPAEMMIVGQNLVPRSEWVHKICKEYNVQQADIDLIKMEKARQLKAASVIAVQWRNRLKRIRARKPSTAPTLRRVKTVG